MSQILINQSVAILCDGNNIERSIHKISKNRNAMINFDTLIPKLLNGRGLNRMIYFREGKSISSKFADRLHENFYGTVIPCHKSADIPISIKATQLSSKVDTIIINGNKQTKDHIIKREILHSMNTPIESLVMLEDINRLYNLGIFSTVDINIENNAYNINVVESFAMLPDLVIDYNENLKTGINIVKKINGFDLKFNIDTDIDGNNQNSNIFINKSF